MLPPPHSTPRLRREPGVSGPTCPSRTGGDVPTLGTTASLLPVSGSQSSSRAPSRRGAEHGPAKGYVGSPRFRRRIDSSRPCAVGSRHWPRLPSTRQRRSLAPRAAKPSTLQNPSIDPKLKAHDRAEVPHRPVRRTVAAQAAAVQRRRDQARTVRVGEFGVGRTGQADPGSQVEVFSAAAGPVPPPHSTPRLRREPGGANALPPLLCSPCQGVSHRAERLMKRPCHRLRRWFLQRGPLAPVPSSHRKASHPELPRPPTGRTSG